MSLVLSDRRPLRLDLPGLRKLHANSPLLFATTVFLVLLLLPLGLAWTLDDRLLGAVSIWAKPMKFATSIALFTGTLVVLIGLVDERHRHTRLMRMTGVVLVAMIAYEQGYITLQATRGMASHFNRSSTLYFTLYTLMGVGASIMTATVLVYARQIRRHAVAGLSPVIRTAAATGLVLTFPLTMMTAGYLGSADSHLVGATIDGPGVWLMGWSTTAGDLRVPHFFATHAMQAVPIAGLISGMLFGWDKRWPVQVFAGLYALFVVALFAQALAGMPFLPLG